MELNLSNIRSMHPRLPESTAAEYIHRCGLGFQRHAHFPNTTINLRIDDIASEAELVWDTVDQADEEQLDNNRITEDAAETVALALVYVTEEWRVVRRLQRFQYGDWLLERNSDCERQLLALEVSGVATDLFKVDSRSS